MSYPDGIVQYPGFLSSVRDATFSREIYKRVRTRRNVVHLALISALSSQLPSSTATKERWLTKQRHQQGRFPRAGSTNDQVNLAPLENQLFVYIEYERPSAGLPRGLRWRRVLRPGERRVTNTDGVLVLVRHVRRDLGSRVLMCIELVDELRLAGRQHGCVP